MKSKMPSIDKWLSDAKQSPLSADCGMFLTHNGVVRKTAKAQVREGKLSPEVRGMSFSYDADKVLSARERAMKMPGIKFLWVLTVKPWLFLQEKKK